MLVGGTALAGFYAAHRRSDDLDLFCRSTEAQRALLLAIASLRSVGAVLESERRTAQFYSTHCILAGHRFTIDAIIDENLFSVGAGIDVDGIIVATLETLLMTKAATLVSRCSEKDLYDLLWILDRRDATLPELVELGRRIDAGVSGESILLVLAGTTLRHEACNFGIGADATTDAIFARLEAFKADLEGALSAYLRALPVPPLGELVRRLRRSPIS